MQTQPFEMCLSVHSWCTDAVVYICDMYSLDSLFANAALQQEVVLSAKFLVNLVC